MVKAEGLPDWSGHVAMIEGDEQGTVPGAPNPLGSQSAPSRDSSRWWTATPSAAST